MIKLYFDDNTTFELPLNAEDEVLKQMSRKPNKRLYTYGVDFTRVIKAEVLNEAIG